MAKASHLLLGCACFTGDEPPVKPVAQESHLTAKIISAVGGGAITFKQEMRRHFGRCFLPVQLLLPSYDFSHLDLGVRLSFYTQYNRLAHIRPKLQ